MKGLIVSIQIISPKSTVTFLPMSAKHQQYHLVRQIKALIAIDLPFYLFYNFSY